MVNHPEHIIEGCGCDPYPPEAQQVGCEGCSPTMYVTCDEESVLAKMRELKEQARPISVRLQEIERSAGGSGTGGRVEYGDEWSALSGRLESLRTQWAEWEQQLDAAIERKMILLGHREG